MIHYPHSEYKGKEWRNGLDGYNKKRGKLAKGGERMKRAYFKYILALLLFGANGIVASRISLISEQIVLLRTLVGSLLLVVIFLVSRKPLTCRDNKRDLLFLAASGAAMGGSWMFLYEAYQQVGVSIASLAYYCGPVIMMVLAPLLFRERLTWPKLAGFAAVLCGVFLVDGKALAAGTSHWGLFCGGMSAVLYAVMVLCNKKTTSIAGLENTMLQLLFGFLTVVVFVGCRQGFAFSIAAGDWLPILLLGLVNTGIGCYFYFSSIGHLPVQTVAVCGYLEPLSAVVFSVIFLHERMLPLQILGALLILGGAVFGECAFRWKRN